jgi:2-octaprenylphenol hydroxylase
MPRVALLGDAAHSIHPLAGQGANLGFSDALVLAEEIASAYKRQLDLGDLSLLKRYPAPPQARKSRSNGSNGRL